MYLDFYEKYLHKDDINRFLEIGVQAGNSMKMWREWLKPNCVVEGWDILKCDEIPGVDIRTVDQLDRIQVLENVSGIYDVILDDGGHTKEMIESSFAYLFSKSKIYIMEDLHAPWTVHKQNLLSKCGWSPLEGTTFQSQIKQTIVNGNLVYDHGRFNEISRGLPLLKTN
jgi:hypothetical protein